MSAIIPRMIMYGIGDGNNVRRDITCGDVDGVWYIGDKESRTWYDELAPVGFFEEGRVESPASR